MRRPLHALFLITLAACGDDDHDGRTVELSFSFADGADGFEAGFADVPPGLEEEWEMVAEVRPLPPELDSDDSGYYVQGNNHSDDMFMFLVRKVEGLEPDAEYRTTTVIQFASNAPTGCFGVGGAPGESVVLKAGAVPFEPEVSVPAGDDHLRIDVDKGNNMTGGDDVSVVGSVANGIPCEESDGSYVPLVRMHEHGRPVATSSAGELWLIVGTDSGFEGLTGIYYRSIDVTLTPVGE